VANNYLWVKTKGGMHLGNRPSSTVPSDKDWNNPTDYLARLKGTTQGPWPAAVVVLSNQLYDVQHVGSDCNTLSVGVRSTYAFEYLKQAAQNGAKIVIRIYPSPGNFTDALQPSPSNPASHNLIADPGVKAASARYCDVVQRKKKDGTVVDTKPAYEFYRDVRDIAREMKAIHDYNYTHAGAILGQEFFMPANEPNTEWYADWYNAEASPKQDNALVWSEMNTYFRNLYDTAKGLDQSIRVLTPAMAQLNKAERIEFGGCNESLLFVPGQPGPIPAAGYDYMEETYRYKNDGLVWHNYWFQAKEFWSDSFCSNPANQTSHHVAQYFPAYLSDQIATSGKPTFILEGDLYSPCLLQGNPIKDKDFYSDATAESLWRFIQQERAAKYVAGWLLTESPHFGTVCVFNRGDGVIITEPNEHAWHEAYRDNGSERSWFPKWWTRNESP
jgi:hypothetical protein